MGLRISKTPPGALLLYDFLVLGALTFGLLAWNFEWAWVDKLPAIIGGVVPLAVPWAGALGGLTISMVGLSRHWSGLEDNEATRKRWNVWYLTHPFIGAVMGSFAVLMVILFFGTLGNTTNGTPIDVSGTNTGVATLGVVAFVIGYRNRVFQDLLKRVADVIVGAGSTPQDDGGGSPTPPPAPDAPAAIPAVAATAPVVPVAAPAAPTAGGMPAAGEPPALDPNIPVPDSPAALEEGPPSSGAAPEPGQPHTD
jgi:hypothetical protein